MEKAQSVLKSCESLLSQTVSSLPPIEKEEDDSKTDENIEEMEVETSKEVCACISVLILFLFILFINA